MNENAEEQGKIRDYAELRPWQFKPGQSGNPGGRPKGSISLKEYARKMLLELNEEEKLEFMRGLDKNEVWRMAEGNPKQDTETSLKLTISDVLNELENGQTPSGQGVEDKSSLQDTEQRGEASSVSA